MTSSLLETARAALWKAVWSTDLAAVRPVRAVLYRGLRVLHMVMREVAAGQLPLWAMSLVYTTLLSLVPLLAVSFSVLKGFGVHDQLEPTLLRVLAPLGERADEIAWRIVEFVENARVGLLGSLGVALLIYTVLSLVQKIERAFNYTWRVHQARKLSQRFSDYLSVLLVGPVLVFTALGLTATLASSSIAQELLTVAPLGWAARTAGTFVPTVLVIAAFTFAYTFLPNTRVRLGPALIGAAAAGVAWQLLGWAFATFVVTSTTAATALYSSFAILVIFMLWLYLSWLILLAGASVAFYTQHPEYLGLLVGELHISSRMKERLAVQCAFIIAQRHYYGLGPLPTVQLADRIGVPLGPVEDVLGAFARAGVLVEAGERADAYVPARDLALIGLDELIDVVQAASETVYLNPGCLQTDAAVDALLDGLREARERALDGRTLRELVAAHPPGGLERAGAPAGAPFGAGDRAAGGAET